MSDSELSFFLVDKMGADPNVLLHQDYSKVFLRIIRNDFELFYNAPLFERESISSRIIAILGEEDEIGRSHMVEWKLVSSGTFNLQTFRGTHFYLFEQVNIVSEFIKQHL